MNFAGILGALCALSIAAFAILDSTKNPKIFLDVHGIVLVIGGTITVALLSFRFGKIFAALKMLIRKTLGKERDDYQGAIKLIVELAEVYHTNPKNLVSSVPPTAHPFLKDAVNLISNYGFSPGELDEILTSAMNGKKKRDDEELKVWHTMSRFPPAFGLLGATLGMISLLQTLGEPGAQERIGPAMATALIATFYGLVVANLVLLPITERLTTVGSADRVMRSIIKEGALMIVEKRHPTFISEYLQSFLAPSLRQAGDEAPAAGGKRAA